MGPTSLPTKQPVVSYPPTTQPTSEPSALPSTQPTNEPTRAPSSIMPSSRPTLTPTGEPSARPTWFGESSQPTRNFDNANVSGMVELFPLSADYCLPVEIRIRLAFHKLVAAGEYVFIGTPGITSGRCEVPHKGGGILSMLMSNSSQLTGRYYEGDYSDNFKSSRMRFLVLQPLQAQQTYYLRIDRANGLKRTCVHNQSWAVTLGHNPMVDINGPPRPTTYSSVGWISFRDSHPLNCFQYYTGLNFYPPYPQQRTTINFTFMIPFTLNAGDYIVLHLPGFTNKKANYPLDMLVNTTGANYRIGVGKDVHGMNATSNTATSALFANTTEGEPDLAMTFSTDYMWRGTWLEGTNTTGELAFNHSRLILYPLGEELNNRMIWVSLNGFENHLISQLGRIANYSGFTVEIFSTAFRLNRTRVMTSAGIGPGCDDFGGCHNSGVCNYEFSRCECFDGFGSAADIAAADANSFTPDCLALACPKGPASVAMERVSGEGYHRDVECSNNGMCDRSKGRCSCFTGFEGVACQRRTCPGEPLCSGRGMCYSMSQLTAVSTALPLRWDSTEVVYDSLGNYTNLQYDVTGNGDTGARIRKGWDAHLSQACVCDSGWPVGLGAGQTQQAEFFGPSCELRRCPSGDDPISPLVDETNCTGKAMFAGGNVGSAGNLCHVDCSNQGHCDYNTGICNCIPRFTGAACNIRGKF